MRAELEQERAVGPEALDAVVSGVGDQYIAVPRVEGHARRRPELAVAAAGTRPADLEGKGAVWMKHLDAVVAGVGDGDHQIMAVHVVGQGDALRRPELAVAAAGTRPADLEGKGAVWMKHLDAVVAGVGDVEGAVLVHGDALRRPELAWAAAGGVVADGRHGLGMGGVRQRRRGQQERRRRRRSGGAGKQRHGRTAARGEGHAGDGRAPAYNFVGRPPADC